jgi:hypothetical protein
MSPAPSSPAPAGRPRWLFVAILLLGFAFLIETCSHVASKVLVHKNYLYKVPTGPGDISYAQVQHDLRPIVGLPPLTGQFQYGGKLVDESGARRSAAYPDFHLPSCISAFGDSFVYAWNVDEAQAWPDALARALHCRVANYGTTGAGTDQAYLRYKLMPKDASSVVILGHMSENIMRNVTRLRDLCHGGLNYVFKPRFILDAAGNLELLPIPDVTEADYRRIVGLDGPPLVLEHETFQPGGPIVSPVQKFPYTFSLLAGLRDYRLRARLSGNRPPWAVLYHPDDPTQGLQITAAIARAFGDEARARGQRALVLIMPELRDLEYFERKHAWSYQPLLEQLDAAKIPYADFGPYLASHQQGPEARSNYSPDGHYNAEANALLARFVAEDLARRGWTPPAAPTH